MVVRREVIEGRLKELAEILRELAKYQDVPYEQMQADLSQRWIIERGLIAAASIVFDVADHILAGHLDIYADTYEGSLRALCDEHVISEQLYQQMKGLGGLRNILIHRYLHIDPRQVFESFHQGLQVFPRFAQEILAWLDAMEQG
jgi:uncharacterized protein YutE (UPF0331/DUF86 family)